MTDSSRALPGWLPRWEDPAWWADYWYDVRPRLVMLRLRVDRLDLRWGMPLWALEETVRFALVLLPWIAFGWRSAPRRWRDAIVRRGGRSRTELQAGARVGVAPGGAPSAPPPWPALLALLEGAGEGLLRMAPGDPFVLVEAGDAARRVHIEITQL